MRDVARGTPRARRPPGGDCEPVHSTTAAGPGQAEQQLDLIAAYRPAAYCGTPDFLKILLDASEAAGRPATSLRKALVSGAAFPVTLQAELKARGM